MTINNTPSVYTAAASTSVSLAIVGIIRWFLSYVHVELPPDVEGDFIVIITGVVHWLLTKEKVEKPVKVDLTSIDVDAVPIATTPTA